MGLLKFFNGHAEASNRAQFCSEILSRQARVFPSALIEKICQNKMEKKMLIEIEFVYMCS